MTFRPWISGVLWLVAYVALIAAVTVSLVDARNHTLSQMDTPQAKAEWETWRQAVRDQPESAPLKQQIRGFEYRIDVGFGPDPQQPCQIDAGSIRRSRVECIARVHKAAKLFFFFCYLAEQRKQQAGASR